MVDVFSTYIGLGDIAIGLDADKKEQDADVIRDAMDIVYALLTMKEIEELACLYYKEKKWGKS